MSVLPIFCWTNHKNESSIPNKKSVVLEMWLDTTIGIHTFLLFKVAIFFWHCRAFSVKKKKNSYLKAWQEETQLNFFEVSFQRNSPGVLLVYNHQFKYGNKGDRAHLCCITIQYLGKTFKINFEYVTNLFQKQSIYKNPMHFFQSKKW